VAENKRFKKYAHEFCDNIISGEIRVLKEWLAASKLLADYNSAIVI